eukprot:scaffold33187_cov62-Phaeocystis_antarctica.AAC.2
MHDSCSGVWATNDLTSLGECEAKLAALPLAEGDEFYFDGNTSAARRPRAGHRAVGCMRSLPPKTATTARTSPSSPWPTPRATSSARSRRRCPPLLSSARTSWPRLQPSSRRSASSRTSTGGCPLARRRPIARRPATWRSTPRPPRAVATRTTQGVSSGRPPNAASSLARCPKPWAKLACACPLDSRGVA